MGDARTPEMALREVEADDATIAVVHQSKSVVSRRCYRCVVLVA